MSHIPSCMSFEKQPITEPLRYIRVTKRNTLCIFSTVLDRYESNSMPQLIHYPNHWKGKRVNSMFCGKCRANRSYTTPKFNC